MNNFNDREKAFENRFARDAELQFKVTARRNRLLGNWAAEKLGLNTAEADAYSREVVAADFEEVGDDDVFRKVYGDLTDGVEVDEGLVTIPTLTIAASQDRATLARAVRKVGEKYARAPVPGDFFEYPDNAHWIVDEPGTDAVVADIVEWLEQPFGEPA